MQFVDSELAQAIRDRLPEGHVNKDKKDVPILNIYKHRPEYVYAKWDIGCARIKTAHPKAYKMWKKIIS